jgi:hypothetical protein
VWVELPELLPDGQQQGLAVLAIVAAGTALEFI